MASAEVRRLFVSDVLAYIDEADDMLTRFACANRFRNESAVFPCHCYTRPQRGIGLQDKTVPQCHKTQGREDATSEEGSSRERRWTWPLFGSGASRSRHRARMVPTRCTLSRPSSAAMENERVGVRTQRTEQRSHQENTQLRSNWAPMHGQHDVRTAVRLPRSRCGSNHDQHIDLALAHT